MLTQATRKNYTNIMRDIFYIMAKINFEVSMYKIFISLLAF